MSKATPWVIGSFVGVGLAALIYGIWKAHKVAQLDPGVPAPTVSSFPGVDAVAQLPELVPPGTTTVVVDPDTGGLVYPSWYVTATQCAAQGGTWWPGTYAGTGRCAMPRSV